MSILQRANLLLVEDDEEIRENFSKTLQNYFSKVYEAPNALEALEIFDQEDIHIIFSDFIMPKMDGAEFIKEVRKVDKQIPIAVISSYTDKEKLMRCIPLNLIGYITKPLNYAALKKFLNEEVAQSLEECVFQSVLSPECFFDHLKGLLICEQMQYQLTKLESELFKILLQYKNAIVPTKVLEAQLYENELISQTGLKNLVYRIRKKYNFDQIQNIRDVGYLLSIEKA